MEGADPISDGYNLATWVLEVTNGAPRRHFFKHFFMLSKVHMVQTCFFTLSFQSVEGVDAIKDGYNPATWVLEVTNSTSERRIGKDFADEYESSDLYM